MAGVTGCLWFGNSVLDGFRDQEGKGLMREVGGGGGIGSSWDPDRVNPYHRSRNACANPGIIYFSISPVGTGVRVWIISEKTVNPRVQSLNLFSGEWETLKVLEEGRGS